MNKYIVTTLAVLSVALGIVIGTTITEVFLNWTIWQRNLISIGLCLLGMGWLVLSIQLSIWSHNRTYAIATVITFLVGIAKFACGLTIICKLS